MITSSIVIVVIDERDVLRQLCFGCCKDDAERQLIMQP